MKNLVVIKKKKRKRLRAPSRLVHTSHSISYHIISVGEEDINHLQAIRVFIKSA